jgi:hypothetical protein
VGKAIRGKCVASRSSICLFVLFTVLATLLVVDFAFFERSAPLEHDFPDDGAERHFSASVVLSGVTYDRQTKSAAAQLSLEIKAINPDLEVRQVSFSHQENPDRSRDVMNCSNEDSCLTEYEDDPKEPGKPVTAARIQFGLIHLQTAEKWAEIFYPFDESTFKLSLLGCVNEGLEACKADNDLSFKTLTIEFLDPDFVLTGDGAVFSIKRKFFIRLVSVIFLIIGVVFFIYLVKLSTTKELMIGSLGYFGTLWGVRSLLVPETVKVFPTLVDYVVLSLFCFLFVLILVREFEGGR